MNIVNENSNVVNERHDTRKTKPVFLNRHVRTMTNCRKTTRGRRNQYIWYQEGNTFPPKMVTKLIQHFK
jgi:hypothetical protein